MESVFDTKRQMTKIEGERDYWKDTAGKYRIMFHDQLVRNRKLVTALCFVSIAAAVIIAGLITTLCMNCGA